jgi:DNA replication protein DnaC
MAITDTLRESLKALKLSSMLSECERLQSDPSARTLSAMEFLEQVVLHELKTRDARGIENRIQQAGFAEIHRLEEFDFKRLPDLDEHQVVELHGCDWIRRGENVVFCGGHGLGKTHLATSIALNACEKGYKVLFRKADKLILELLEARDQSRLLAMRARLLRVPLVVVDEIGYTPFEKEGGELLHGVLSDRYEARRSVIVTTNLEFGRWVEVFKSKEMTVALLDRLTHRCEVVVLTGKSRRHEESMELQRQRRTKRGGKEVARA